MVAVNMAHKVLIPQMIAKEGLDYLIRCGYELKIGTGVSEAELCRDVTDCDAVLLRTAKVGAAVLEAGTKLKIVARHGAGYDNVDCKAAEKLGIWVTNSPFSTGNSVAEFTIGALLTVAKKLDRVSRAFTDGDFNYKNSHKGMDLAGKTLGIVGFGKIGSMVAKKAALGFDMKVLAYVPRPEGKEIPDYVMPVSWDELWSKSDFVSLHIPGGSGNMGVVGKSEFDAMKKGACLINTSRGGVVKEGELAAALKSGKLGGAAMDVFEEEPPQKDHPLFALDNVFLTPHMASNTEECMIRMAMDAAMEIHRVLSGDKPQWPVNQP